MPRRITLDIDDTFDAVHGAQQLRLFNAHYDDYGFQPIVVFDADGHFVTALLRPARRPKGVEIRGFLRRLTRAIRSNWPNVQILVRADSHYACPEVFDWCEANGLDYVFGLASTRSLKRHVIGLENSTSSRFRAAPAAGKVRRFKEAYDAAKTWSRVRRIIARVEAGSDGTDTRFVVTSLDHGSGRSLYQDLYCRRGQAENHIKAWKTHLAADRTSCPEPTANQFRLFLHAGAYWLLWPARPDAPTFILARRPVRHAEAPADQDRRPRRRNEIQDQDPSAYQRPRSRDLALGHRPPAAADPMNTGAGRPTFTPSPSTASPIKRHPPPTAAKPAMPGHNQKMMKPVHQAKLTYRGA